MPPKRQDGLHTKALVPWQQGLLKKGGKKHEGHFLIVLEAGSPRSKLQHVSSGEGSFLPCRLLPSQCPHRAWGGPRRAWGGREMLPGASS